MSSLRLALPPPVLLLLVLALPGVARAGDGPAPPVGTPSASAQEHGRRPDGGVAPGAASVATVVTKDASGNRLATGVGFFLEIGRLVVPRALLLDRAYSAAILYGGREQRVTAVLADDERAGLALVSVDLPEGAPPAIRTRSTPRDTRPGRYQAPAADGSGPFIEISAERDVPGVGAVCAVSSSGALPDSGSPLVDRDGELVGVLVDRSAAGTRLAIVLPTARVLRLPPVGPLTLAEWLRRPRLARSEETEGAFLRGIQALLQDRHDDAAAAFRAATADGPGLDADAAAALAAAEIAAGRRDAGIASYRAAIAAAPDSPRLHHELALALGDGNRWEEASREFAEVTRLRPMDPEAHFNLGSAYGHLGRLADEYTAYQAALRENSAHVKALRNLGIVCIALKRYAEAVAVSARALRLLPADAPLHAQLGVAYFDLGNYQAAIDALKKAVDLDPEFVRGHYGLALVYAASGQRQAALAECETLKRLDPARGAEVMQVVSGRK